MVKDHSLIKFVPAGGDMQPMISPAHMITNIYKLNKEVILIEVAQLAVTDVSRFTLK